MTYDLAWLHIDIMIRRGFISALVLLFSMDMEDHEHSRHVMYYHVGLGGHDGVSSRNMTVKTLASILARFDEREVGAYMYIYNTPSYAYMGLAKSSLI